ncbi:MAG: sensor histidine kinase [Bacteroidota bacterium]
MVFRPFPSTIINGILLSLSITFLAFLSWKYSSWIFKYSVPVQVIGHIVGLVLWFYTVASISYFIEYYIDGFRTIDEWKEFILEQFGSKSLLYNLEYVTAIAVFYILKYVDTITEKENEKATLAIVNNEMQMSLLKSQINPHFLFNTLNSISTLMNVDKDKARHMMNKLSDVLRYALDSNNDLEVPLNDELTFIRNYINIQQVRFGDRLKYKENIDEECLSLLIPPMVLQPLVENSVKHGITPKEEGGTITIDIKKNNSKVTFRVSDNGVGLGNKSHFETNNSGVGLVNSDMRLQNMYGKDSKLRVMADDSGFTVDFNIPAYDD